MDKFVSTNALGEALATGLLAYMVMMAGSQLIGLFLWSKLKGGRATFLFVTSLLFALFVFGFYGLDFMLTHVWIRTEDLGRPVVFGISLAFGLVLMLAPVVPMHFLFNDFISPDMMDDQALTALSDDEINPLDRQRKHLIERRNRRRL